jgi:hypothetical protein
MSAVTIAVPDDTGDRIELDLADISDKFLDFNGYGELCVWQHNPARPQYPIELAGIAHDIDSASLVALADTLSLPVFEGFAVVMGVQR